jgi:NAD(P)-dependent dehydrogenase (short-subunit alcohol dehydrogenase family)/acyl carrier protein
MIQTMVESEVRLFIEVGPGRVLSRLVQAIVEGMPTKPTVDVTALDESAGKRSGVVELAQILARVAAHGFQVKLASWDGSTSHPATMPPVAKPGHTIPICGANYVKPKPQRPPVAKPAPVIGLPAEPRPLEPKQKPASLQPAPTPVRVTTVTEPLKTNPLPQSSLDHALHVTRDGLTAFERLQEQTAQLHRQFLLGQDAAQQALARLIEQQQQLLLASLNGSSVVVPAPPSVPVAALPIPAFDAVAAVPVAETPRVAEPVAAPPPPPPVSKQEKAPPPAVTDVEKIRNVLLSVVAEKTGYPPEMLDLGMGLDADLGIDSIKRVEILSALQERLPDAPAVKPEHLGTLNTLQAIVDFLSNGLASPVLAAAAPVPKPVVTENRAGDAVTRTLLEVIAEKTGYPPEMLDLDMGLDADLGIDSIKRVEILSALQERMPDAPVVKPEHLGALNTLRAIVDFLVGAPVVGPLPASAPVENQALPAPIEEQPLPAPSDDRHNVVLSRRVLKIARLASEHRPSARISPGSKIWLIAQPSAYAEEMVGEIRRRGFDCHRFGWGDAQPPAPEGLGGMVLFAPELMDDDQMLAGFRWARQSAAALRRAGRAGGACFVTVSQLDGQFGLGDRALVADPVSGGLAGLAKTASHEWPDVTCRAVDVEPGRVSSATLIEECLRSGPVEVGITTDGFWETSLTEAPITAGIQTPFSRSDVILLTGGARGVTAEAAVALAEAYQPTLVVFGRSPEPVSEPEWLNGLTDEAEIKRELGRQLNGNVSPKVIGEHYHRLAANREVQANLARMKRAGARVIYRAVDVREPDEVAAAIADVRSQVGPITGLIHGAGVLADRRIDEMTDDQFRAVFDTKVNGLRHLIQAAGNDPLKAIVLYSSSTGRFGRTGQANYAVANEILNKMAQQLRRLRRECRIVAINWGPWEGGMVTPALRKVFASEGIGLIPLADGAGLMVAELTASDRATEIVVGRAASAAEVPASTDLQPAFERELSLSLAPCLASHVLDGNAVFPAALHAEWLGHSAMHGNPGLMFHGFNDIRICHGVRLAPDDTAVIRAYAGKANKRDGQFFVPVELRGLRRDGREIVHSRAEVILAGQLPVAPTPNLVSPAKPFPDSIETVYEKQLFHGRDFQGLVTIEGIDEKSIVATARTAPSPNQWLAQPLRPNWLADPLAMDVAFQLAVVWGQWRHRSPGLPASAARYRQYVRSFPAGIVRIVVRVTHDGAAVARFDIDFVETTGRMLARIEGCECVRDAGLAAAYRRNRLLLKV